jgi:tRNA C32,U32 (ribose-2'-O)-methylase TrmJ
LVEIPTDVRQPSMNLGQAVAVCLYELAVRPPSGDKGGLTGGAATASPVKPDDEAPATAGGLNHLAGLVAETMEAANYSPAAMRAANRHDLQLLLCRLNLTRRDARHILGFFRRILWRLMHSGDQIQK